MGIKRSVERQVAKHGVLCNVHVPGTYSRDEDTRDVSESGGTDVTQMPVVYSSWREEDLPAAEEVRATDSRLVLLRSDLGVDLERGTTVSDGSNPTLTVVWLQELRASGELVGYVASARGG